jgi:hypothetical protein
VLIILIIGILYYYLGKEGFVDNTQCLGSELDFNTDDKYTDYDKIFSKVYNNNIILKDSGKYLTFINKDFTELPHQKAIASFLGLREAINLKANNNYQHYVIKHKMRVLFKSPVDKYLEITFNNFDNIPFVKIIYNHTNKKCIIENKLPDYQETPLIPGGSNTKEIDLPNGFGTTIEFVSITLKRNGENRNQFGFIIDNNMYCYNLLMGIDNHFYNALKNITIYAPNTNMNNTFTITHMCSGEIYASYADSKIKSYRFPYNSNNYTVKGTNWDKLQPFKKPFNLLRPNVVSAGWYPLGSYLIYNLGNTNDYYNSPLIVQEGDYVQSSMTYSNKWDNDGKRRKGSKRGANYQFTLLNADDRVINIKGSDYTFRALGGSVLDNKPIDKFNGWQVALIREDCLEENPNNLVPLWYDRGSGARRDGSIWTYNNPYMEHAGVPGQNLAIFQEGYNQPPRDKKWIIKESCLVPQPQLLTDSEISQIDALVDDKIKNYLTAIVALKLEKDAIINPNTSQMNNSIKFKTEINTTINNSKSKYDSDYTQNMNVNNMQNQYNKHYDFINLLKDTVTPVKNNEKTLYNDYLPKINQITKEMDNKILSEPIGLFSEIDSNFITKSQQTSDLVQQYNLQRDNDRVLKFMGEQVSK